VFFALFESPLPNHFPSSLFLIFLFLWVISLNHFSKLLAWFILTLFCSTSGCGLKRMFRAGLRRLAFSSFHAACRIKPPLLPFPKILLPLYVRDMRPRHSSSLTVPSQIAAAWISPSVGEFRFSLSVSHPRAYLPSFFPIYFRDRKTLKVFFLFLRILAFCLDLIPYLHNLFFSFFPPKEFVDLPSHTLGVDYRYLRRVPHLQKRGRLLII